MPTIKTAIIWVGSQSNPNKLVSRDCSLSVGAETIQPLSSVRDLRVLNDNELSMKIHVSKFKSPPFASSSFVVRFTVDVGQDVTIRLVLALITSRLDY